MYYEQKQRTVYIFYLPKTNTKATKENAEHDFR